MNDVAIRVEGLGKQYHIGRQQARYKTIRETIVDGAKAPFRRAGRIVRGRGSAADLDETIWALKDVSFEVKQGEVVGVIGRNGAGKTTLLKLLSRITEPTAGDAWIHGRVGSLLEVGTGFHPELTGRENIYLNGAILGMSRNEIDRKFDEIVDFSGIEKFIDTPAKHYSSGMYVRLAFSVAAHMETEILLVDEVLAVGDVEFQKKCLGKMGDVARGGRTILFVSHNMVAISRLCEKAMLLDSGNVDCLGRVDTVITEHLSSSITKTAIAMIPLKLGASAQIDSIEIRNQLGNNATEISVLEEFSIVVNFHFNERMTNSRIIVDVINSYGALIFVTYSSDQDVNSRSLGQGIYRAEIFVPGEMLSTGSYVLSAYIDEPGVKVHHRWESALTFSLVGNPFGTNDRRGIIWHPFKWNIDSVTRSLGDRS